MTNQEALRALIAKSGITQEEAANIIEDASGKPCSVRSVRSWLADPSIRTSRNCPPWPYEALKKGLAGCRKRA